MKRIKVYYEMGWDWVVQKGKHEAWFKTWREAMDYADRLARTREVVLPRAGRNAFEEPIWLLDDGLVVTPTRVKDGFTFISDYPRMTIPNHLRTEFAAALLALDHLEAQQ